MRVEYRLKQMIAGLLLAGFGSVAVSCSTGEPAPDRAPTESEAAEADADVDVDERGIPPLAPLEMAEDEPAVEELGEVDGVSAYRVGDVTVLHKETPANSVVSARVYVSGGSANLTEQTAGVEKLALSTTVNGGTETHSKDEFNALLDSMGSSVSAFSDRDFSGYTMQSIVDNFDVTWDLMLETMVEPSVPESELELQRERHLAEIRSLRDNPDRLVGYVASKLLFEGHPYHTMQLGTEENVSDFSRDQIAAYQRAMLQPDRLTVVVVGNVSNEDIIERVKPLAKMRPAGTIPQQELTEFGADEADITVEEKEIPTNYIFGLFTAPAPGDEDYEAMLVTAKFLRDRLFEEVRTKRNLTYAVSAGLSDRRINYGYLYVTAVDPDETLPVIFDEIDKLKEGDFSAEDLEQSRNVFITSHYMDLETNSSQASMLGRSHLIAGDWKAHADLIDRLEEVTAEDVERVTTKYMKNYHFGVVGDPDQINEAMFLQQEAQPEEAEPTAEQAEDVEAE